MNSQEAGLIIFQKLFALEDLHFGYWNEEAPFI